MGKAICRKFYWDTVGEKFQIGIAYSLIERRTILVGMAGKKQSMAPMWKKLMTKC